MCLWMARPGYMVAEHLIERGSASVCSRPWYRFLLYVTTDATFCSFLCSFYVDVKDIVVGHEDGTVRLYRYPSVFPEAIHQSYIGHSSRVKSVTYSYNRRYVISIGGDDGTILLWKHEVEQVFLLYFTLSHLRKQNTILTFTLVCG